MRFKDVHSIGPQAPDFGDMSIRDFSENIQLLC